MRERQRALSRKVRSIGWVPNRFGEGGEQVDCRRARGVPNPCVRESNAGKRLRENMISDFHRLVGCFQGFIGLWTAGC